MQPQAMRPQAVFVYGTLKQGERNFRLSQRVGFMRSEEAWVEGFKLYAVGQARYRRPYSYPALVAGQGRVWGEVHWFADLPKALERLDKLERVGREYLRLEAVAHTAQQSWPVWLYAYPHSQAIERAQGVWLPEGRWTSIP